MDSNEVIVDGVPIGPTEIITVGTMVSSLAIVIFGQDWGIATHIQTIAAQAMVILPIALGVLRSFKHQGNVKVAVAQIAALAAGTPVTVVNNTTPPAVPVVPVVVPDTPVTPVADTSIPADLPIAPTS